MYTKIVNLNEDDVDEQILKEAGEFIKNGKLVVFPTETVYGLGANAEDGEATKKIFEAKGRPQDNPLIIHISDFEDVDKVVRNISDSARKLMREFWPGPMTLIMEKKSIISDVTSAGLTSVGVRMPSDKIARKLIKFSGVSIAAPSANLSGKPSPTDVERCIEDLNGKVDYIIGGNKCEYGLESTVIDCTVNPVCILRPGAITLEMVRKVDEKAYIDPAIMAKPEPSLKPKAPGMKYKHYAPKAPVKIIDGDLKKTIEKINEMVQNYIDDNKKVGIMATDETKNNYRNAIVISLGSRKDIYSIGRNLFETLRDFDDCGVDVILSEAFDEEGFGVAIMNRLNKSAGFDIINV
ncbi:L-threonylcarbamoyladenylate synthase [Clostridium acetobutylicum]|uniref:Threonylcarbamoyl-AMP synthase n=1 Tax=Clostridium acetobutylicum (strain ATCC 824 / DSM 792 / JCM 1419 / IAM 19013 / LMG 5710 / NBRC 13948 / NRRL B-527 / VKM B-1787 / 2291 / W) TaxID=272562 RepID=Q97F70_CLOAB|nr:MULTISPECIES: L-threonylcarbamoyladenylate synthase [Clostridium]AAK80825.1 Predicted translation factor (SUA5) [Clostridium acetobutylicum ATCC 824]ADZ21926.1 translation factor (SUA5) [Clostridium acetobutylicum EA 2018]AEI33313.1 translation factor (SUA5) [Clostridium acetobutylicum DSM 1731]AWV78763.1 threonylcarbamoyl-AMP synthase [Clostridium acetobutylicum]MBC2393627.1 threonylcarbamoyl-AMP synthase [Clostridium acetobutylicum]